MLKPLLLLAILLIPSKAYSQTITFTSENTQTALIELYTSEGCSSCPPADQYLSKLKKHPQLFKQFIPIALHVDYWDYIGWRDKFAVSDNAKRQRKHRAYGHSNAVYTPGFFINGNEWRGFFNRDKLHINSEKQTGQLILKLNDDTVNITFQALNNALTQDQQQIHIALLGFDLITNVKAGENNNRKLAHDFVVLNHQKQAIKNKQGILSAQFHIAKAIQTTQTDKLALVAWVEEKLTPIQAVGGYL